MAYTSLLFDYLIMHLSFCILPLRGRIAILLLLWFAVREWSLEGCWRDKSGTLFLCTFSPWEHALARVAAQYWDFLSLIFSTYFILPFGETTFPPSFRLRPRICRVHHLPALRCLPTLGPEKDTSQLQWYYRF